MWFVPCVNNLDASIFPQIPKRHLIPKLYATTVWIMMVLYITYK